MKRLLIAGLLALPLAAHAQEVQPDPEVGMQTLYTAGMQETAKLRTAEVMRDTYKKQLDAANKQIAALQEQAKKLAAPKPDAPPP